MSELDVDAIEARANAARSGPWKWHWDVFGDGSSSLDRLDGGGEFVLSAHGMHTDGWIDADDADAEFIAYARTDVPALVSRVRELEAAKVWIVLSHCYEDVRVEDVFDSREQAEAEYDIVDGNGFSTGYEIVEKNLIRRSS